MRELYRGRLGAGAQTIKARAAVAGGLYFVRIVSGEAAAVRQVVVK